MALVVAVFAVAVTCSVICPEQAVPLAKHQYDSVCTDCTSTDFIGGAKISDEPIVLDASAAVVLDLTATSAQYPFIPAYISPTIPPLLHPQRIFLLNLDLRLRTSLVRKKYFPWRLRCDPDISISLHLSYSSRLWRESKPGKRPVRSL
jgi:hypothetical protein